MKRCEHEGGGLTVACVLPMRGHAVFVDLAVRQFLEQRHGLKILVIAHPAGELPEGPAIRALAADQLSVLYEGLDWPGLDESVLERAAQSVDADVATWWLPADRMTPQRLCRQVETLVAGGVKAVEACDTLTYLLNASCATAGVGATRGTLMVRRGERHTSGGGDTLRETDPDWYLTVAFDPASPRSADPGERASRPLSHALTRMGSARAVYAAWRTGRRTPLEYRPASVGPRPLNLAVPLLVFDGFGSMGEYLVRGLARELEINVTPLSLNRTGLHPETIGALDRSAPARGDPTLAMAWVGAPFDRFGDARPLFVFTMWESTELPAGFASRLNQARLVLVPSSWVAETFRRSGVRVPIEVVPQGADPDRYPLVDKPAPDPDDRALTTLVVAAVSGRKNIAESVEAWLRSFDGNPHARLVIKSRFGWTTPLPEDPRIRLVASSEPTPGISHWYAQADVVLALGGEGFGLPLVEAMASGVPVIALDAQGQRDVVSAAPGCLIPVPPDRWVPYDDGTYAVGERAVPDVGAVADALTWVSRHRVEAWRMGRRASRWAHSHRNIWDLAPRLVEVLGRHLDEGEELIPLGASEPSTTPSPLLSHLRSLQLTD